MFYLLGNENLGIRTQKMFNAVADGVVLFYGDHL